MKKNVMIFPCGSQPAIDINNCLRESLRFEVFGASSISDHGKYAFKNYIGNVPNIADPNFLVQFNKILKQNNIHFIIPTHDSIALFLIEQQLDLAAMVVASEIETNKICRYKSLTYKKFHNYNFIPKLFNSKEEVNEFPVFLKPDAGQGGKGTYIVNSKEELYFILNLFPDLLVCEYLPGEEFTVDCFTDRNTNLRLISPRTRGRVFGGISVNSRLIETNDEIQHIAQTLNNKLKFRGYWFFQLKTDQSGKLKLLEISTRMAGTSCLTMNRDINLPLLALMDAMDMDIEIIPNNYEIELDRAFINRYRLDIKYERVYVDLDDTLILRNEYCNQYLLMFLYQCLNNKKEIILITKHNFNVNETLLRYKISPSIFSHIIQMNLTDNKFQYIGDGKEAIFIDNSFAERKEIKEKLNIPTFDTNNIECLIDWRG